MKKKILFVLGICVLFSGCSITQEPQKNKSFNMSDMSKNDDIGVCTIYGMRVNGSGLAKQEIIKRGLFSDTDWKFIQQGKIKLGMSECGLLAAYGLKGRKSQSFLRNNATKKLISKSYRFDCKESRSTICPQTEIVIKNDKIVEIKKFDR